MQNAEPKRSTRLAVARLLSRDDAASFLGISLTTFQEHVQSQLPVVRIGRRLLFDLEDLKIWVDRQKQATDFDGRVSAPMSVSHSRGRSMTISPRARAMKERLTRSPAASTRTLSKED